MVIETWNKNQFHSYFIDDKHRLKSDKFNSFTNISQLYDLYNMDYLCSTTYKVVKVKNNILCIVKYVKKKDVERVDFFSVNKKFKKHINNLKEILNIDESIGSS